MSPACAQVNSGRWRLNQGEEARERLSQGRWRLEGEEAREKGKERDIAHHLDRVNHQVVTKTKIKAWKNKDVKILKERKKDKDTTS